VCVLGCFVCLSFFHQKPSRFHPYVSVHVSRSAMRPIATVSHIAWSVYLRIFRDVHGLFLLMTHVLCSVYLFVCGLGWFVCLSFPSKNQLVSIRVFLYMYRVCDAAYCYSVPHTVVCLFDFRHRYQHRSRRLLLHILQMLGKASYFPHVWCLNGFLLPYDAKLVSYMDMPWSLSQVDIVSKTPKPTLPMCRRTLCRNRVMFFLNVTKTKFHTRLLAVVPSADVSM